MDNDIEIPPFFITKETFFNSEISGNWIPSISIDIKHNSAICHGRQRDPEISINHHSFLYEIYDCDGFLMAAGTTTEKKFSMGVNEILREGYYIALSYHEFKEGGKYSIKLSHRESSYLVP